jgi:hypothetical protein
MDREDMRNLIWYGNACSKYTKKKLSEITVEECLNFMEFEIWNRRIYALPVLDCNRFLILPK